MSRRHCTFLSSWGLAAVLTLALSGCPSESGPPPTFDGPTTWDTGRDQQTPDTLKPDLFVPDLPDNVPPHGAILVSPVGLDSPTCGITKATACATIAQGIKRAQGYQPPRPIALAPGNYVETVNLASGLELLGGYNADFKKLGSGNKTAVIKGVITGGEAVALIAENLTAKTVVDSVHIVAPQPTQAGKSSYGVIINNAPQVVFRNCTIQAAKGVDGVDGKGTTTAAANGNAGKSGSAGANYTNFFATCSLVTPTAGFPGAGGSAIPHGVVVCGSKGGRGGQAGMDSCKGMNGQPGSLISAPTTTCTTITAGAGGKGGTGGIINSSTCQPDPTGGAGHDGCDGKNGTNGKDGDGGKTRIIGSYFASTDGENGAEGINDATGGGGGGGGGGGDCDFFACHNCLPDFGGGGGGAGSAGCSGKGGTGGTSGSGSFAVFIVGSAATITVEGCTLITGDGGKGGAGGAGQPGGKGGGNGKGGTGFQEGGDGGKGGKGGSGGSGGHGGGGAGGPSVGIYVTSGTAPTVTTSSFQLGTAGKGGSSQGKPGEDGVKADIHQ